MSMFGFGKAARRLTQISLEVQNLLGLLGSDPKLSEESIPALRSALKYVTDNSTNADPPVYGILKRSLTASAIKQNTGAAYGYRLVALMLECREIDTKASLDLAVRINEVIVQAISRFPREPKATAAEVRFSAESEQLLTFAADGLRRVVRELGLPEQLHFAPPSLGLIWGWGHEFAEAMQLPKGSRESARAVQRMFDAILDLKGSDALRRSLELFNAKDADFVSNGQLGRKAAKKLLMQWEVEHGSQWRDLSQAT